DPDVQRAVAIDDVVAAAALDGVAATTAEQDVALGPDVRAGARALAGRRGGLAVGQRRGQRRDELVQARDAGDARRVERVTAGEPAATGGPRRLLSRRCAMR